MQASRERRHGEVSEEQGNGLDAAAILALAAAFVAARVSGGGENTFLQAAKRPRLAPGPPGD